MKISDYCYFTSSGLPSSREIISGRACILEVLKRFPKDSGQFFIVKNNSSIHFWIENNKLFTLGYNNVAWDLGNIENLTVSHIAYQWQVANRLSMIR